LAERINIIHVHDEQYYFSFNHRLRTHDGNRILDPFAIIYDEQLISESTLARLLTSSVYFIAETNNPFAEIEPLIHYHGIQSEIQ